MSFDVYFQRFRDGDAATGGGAQMVALIQPYVVEEDDEVARLRFGDGEATVYLRDDGMMANHVGGEEAWDVLVRGARAADWVIVPVGCPTCITAEEQRAHLPAGIDEDVVLVGTGADLLRVITTA